jgi:LPXTG-motif cell wall-anchored protein
VHRWGRRIGIREHEIDRSVAWFERHGPVAVLLGRVVPVIRTFISLPAGFAGMPAGRFGLYTTLGCIPWTAALGIAGYALGANWEHIAKDFNGPTYAIAGILVIGVIAFIVVRRRRNKLTARDARGVSVQPKGAPGYPSVPGQPPNPGYQPRPAQQPGPGQYGPSQYGPSQYGPAQYGPGQYGQQPAQGQYPSPPPGDWRPADPRQSVGQATDRAGWTRIDAQPGGYQWEPPSEREQQQQRR